jgi:hypothetical protein
MRVLAAERLWPVQRHREVTLAVPEALAALQALLR